MERERSNQAEELAAAEARRQEERRKRNLEKEAAAGASSWWEREEDPYESEALRRAKAQRRAEEQREYEERQRECRLVLVRWQRRQRLGTETCRHEDPAGICLGCIQGPKRANPRRNITMIAINHNVSRM
jgi:hypothetical protein